MAMPVLYSGHRVPAAEFAQITDAIDAHDASLVDGARFTFATAAATNAYSSETNISRLALSGPIVSGQVYEFCGQVVHKCSTTDTECSLRLRHTTPVSGTLIGSARLGRSPYANNGRLVTWSIPWVATFTDVGNFYFSILRTTGTGDTTLDGGEFAFTYVKMVGRYGTIRTITS